MSKNKIKQIYINSKNRLANETTTDFCYTFEKPICIKKYLKLQYSWIPNTSYLINSTNNKFKITFWDTTVKNIVIPSLNYSTWELATTIKNLVNYDSFNMVFSSSSYKYTFWSGTYEFTINNIENNCYSILGLIGDSNSTWLSLISQNIVNFLDPSLLLLDIKEVSNANIYTNDFYNATYILPITSTKNNIWYFTENSFNNVCYCSGNFNEFNIVLKQIDGWTFDNNNLDIQLIFCFE